MYCIGPPKPTSQQALSIVAEAAMHVEQEQERQMQLQKQQQQLGQQQLQQQIEQLTNVEQGQITPQKNPIETETQLSNDESRSYNIQQYASLQETPTKLQDVQTVRNPAHYVSAQGQQQFLNQTQSHVQDITRQTDDNLRSPLKSSTPVKYITHTTTKAQMQSFKIIPQEQSGQQIQQSGGSLTSGGSAAPRGAIPVYVAMQTGGAGQPNQPKLVPIAVIAKPPTQPQQHGNQIKQVL